MSAIKSLKSRVKMDMLARFVFNYGAILVVISIVMLGMLLLDGGAAEASKQAWIFSISCVVGLAAMVLGILGLHFTRPIPKVGP